MRLPCPRSLTAYLMLDAVQESGLSSSVGKASVFLVHMYTDLDIADEHPETQVCFPKDDRIRFCLIILGRRSRLEPDSAFSVCDRGFQVL
jgi:hypothetical protein